MKNKITTSELAVFLGSDYLGDDLEISIIAPLAKAVDGSLVFAKNRVIPDHFNQKCVVLVPKDTVYENTKPYSIIRVDNPRLDFAKTVSKYFIDQGNRGIDKSTSIGIGSDVGSSVAIGKNCIIGENVVIGDDTIINHNVVISDDTRIGRGCYIKSGSVIGEDGFGFDFERDGTPVRIPHIGRVTIGDFVEVGSNTVIVRGTLEDTVIGNNVKIDDQVFVAHNCLVGDNSILTACCELSGSVIVGKNCWIGPNSSIIQKTTIGDYAMLGIGSVVTRDVKDYEKVMGIEAMGLRNLIKVRKRMGY